eukprot:gene6748-biopygen3610
MGGILLCHCTFLSDHFEVVILDRIEFDRFRDINGGAIVNSLASLFGSSPRFPLFKDVASHRIVDCIKSGLRKSFERHAVRGDRPLDPKTDFTIKSQLKLNQFHEEIGPTSSVLRCGGTADCTRALPYAVTRILVK